MIGSALMAPGQSFIKTLIVASKIIIKVPPLLLKNRKVESPWFRQSMAIFDATTESGSVYDSPSLDTYVKMDFVGVVCIFYALLLAYVFHLSSLFTPIVSLTFRSFKELFGDINLPKLESIL